eukprot:gb/GECG01004537.1/.p1 GENE.gb/GECG01004537.1/~~gb/GECG01004537.1/.p1  ORF type:complete len:139 (+),score=6.27 gb/GECG01004537.1/:1-417(+)
MCGPQAVCLDTGRRWLSTRVARTISKTPTITMEPSDLETWCGLVNNWGQAHGTTSVESVFLTITGALLGRSTAGSFRIFIICFKAQATAPFLSASYFSLKIEKDLSSYSILIRRSTNVVSAPAFVGFGTQPPDDVNTM